MIGTRLGPYELVEEIGKGGMATVYRAYQPSMDRPVAVKVIQRTVADDATGLERFQREARLIAKLEHPHLLPVYDYNSAHDPPYIVMRFIKGGTLKDRLTTGPLPFHVIVSLTRQIATALDYAHRQGIIHRDLKPSNIMLDEEGNAFLTDFGIARLMVASSGGAGLTQTGLSMGTPGYMAPEQGMGQSNVGPAADLYSLAVMLFEMLTGGRPFEAETPMAVVLKHIQEPPPKASSRNAQVPVEVDGVLLRALAKKPEERFATAAELAQALSSALSAVITTTPISLRSASATVSVTVSGASSATPATPGKQRALAEQHKQVTVLYLDTAEFERMTYETAADDEEAREKLRPLWERINETLSQAGQGSTTVKRSDSALTLLWGVDNAREDDPERAIRAALALREATRSFAVEETLPLQMGLTTGTALLTPAADGTVTASGNVINLASRLPAAMPEGGLVLTNEIYRLVRGVFNVRPLPPLRVRGNKEALDVYQVLDAKPRAFRVTVRGVEGIETRMVGFEAELRQLQEALETALEDGETQWVTLLGEAGVGKSRMLYEFRKWREVRPETFYIFMGRATPEMMNQPYALWRDVFSFRCEIQDTDSPASVKAKMEKGIERFMGAGHTEHAHFIGHLIGFDFSDSPHLQGVLGNAQRFHDRAWRCFAEFFRAAARLEPDTMVVVTLEDLHWADDKSLDALSRLVTENPDERLMLASAARPALLERRPAWGQGQRAHTRVELRPLSKRDARKLVKEVLQKVTNLPDDLRDLIVERSEGNPFYVEELVKILIEDRVIVKGEETWEVQTGQLAAVRVPPTLTGVLQTRLDSLLPDERTVLQRAAVIGRIFWDSALAALQSADDMPIAVSDAVTGLLKRELIYPRDTSAVAGAREYIFGSSLLRDVAYDSALKRQQRAYHARVAEWLIETGGERASERQYTALIADHYERAGANEKAAEYLKHAGQQANQISALREAMSAFEHALNLLGEAASPAATTTRMVLLIWLGDLQVRLSDYARATEHLLAGLALAREARATKLAADALSALCLAAARRGNFADAQKHAEEAIGLAREAGDKPALALALRRRGVVAISQGDYDTVRRYHEDSLTLYREINDQDGIASCLNNLGVMSTNQGDYVVAARYYEESLTLARTLGDREAISRALHNRGEVARLQGQHAEAATYYEESLAICRELGTREIAVTNVLYLGDVALAQGNEAAARRYYHDGLVEAMEIGAVPRALQGLAGMAELAVKHHHYAHAAELLGLVLNHLACDSEVKMNAEPVMAALHSALPAHELQAALERGQGQTLEAVVKSVLAPAT